MKGCPRAAAAATLLFAALAAPAAAADVSFSRLNRSYDDLVSELPPVEQGALVLHLASPSNRLVVETHRLELEPLGDGTHRAVLDVVFLGAGHLVGRVELAGAATPLDDRVVLPRQRLRLPGRVRIGLGLEGIEITPLELPDGVAVAVQSTSGNRLLGWCEQLGALLPVDCSPLALTSVDVGLPQPGETWVVPLAEVEPAERTALLRYLEATSRP